MTIGQSIKQHRKDRGLTQAELAGIVDCAQYQVSSWESGRMFPNVLNFISLADAFEVSLDDLVGRTKKAVGNVERCIVCGEVIPEGRQVCPMCEKQNTKSGLSPAEVEHEP